MGEASERDPSRPIRRARELRQPESAPPRRVQSRAAAPRRPEHDSASAVRRAREPRRPETEAERAAADSARWPARMPGEPADRGRELGRRTGHRTPERGDAPPIHRARDQRKPEKEAQRLVSPISARPPRTPELEPSRRGEREGSLAHWTSPVGRLERNHICQ